MSQNSSHVDPGDYRSTLASLRGEPPSTGNKPNQTQRRLPPYMAVDRTDVKNGPRDKITVDEDAEDFDENPLRSWFKKMRKFVGALDPAFPRVNRGSNQTGDRPFPCRRRLLDGSTTPSYEIAGFLLKELVACSQTLAGVRSDTEVTGRLLTAVQLKIDSREVEATVIRGEANMTPVCNLKVALFVAEVCDKLRTQDPDALARLLEKRPAILTSILFPYCNDTAKAKGKGASEGGGGGRVFNVKVERLSSLVSRLCDAHTILELTEWILNILSALVFGPEAKNSGRSKAMLKILDSLLKSPKDDVREKLHNLILSTTKYDSCANDILALGFRGIEQAMGDQKTLEKANFYPLKTLGALLCIADVQPKKAATNGEPQTVSHMSKLPNTMKALQTRLQRMVEIVTTKSSNPGSLRLQERLIVVMCYLVRLSQDVRQDFTALLSQQLSSKVLLPPAIETIMRVLFKGDSKVSIAGSVSLINYTLTRFDPDSNMLRKWFLSAGLADLIVKIWSAEAPKSTASSEEKDLFRIRREVTQSLAQNIVELVEERAIANTQDQPLVQSAAKYLMNSKTRLAQLISETIMMKQKDRQKQANVGREPQQGFEMTSLVKHEVQRGPKPELPPKPQMGGIGAIQHEPDFDPRAESSSAARGSDQTKLYDQLTI